MIRAVIDTNVLVSGLISPKGNEALTILAINHGFVCPCLSDAVMQEYTSVLARPKFAFLPHEIADMVAMIVSAGEFFSPVSSAAVSPDPADTKFLHLAITARADVIVTGNKRHFPDSPYGHTRVVNAREVLDWITAEI